MNGPHNRIPLQHEDGWSAHGGWIVLDNNSATYTGQNVTYRYIILGKLVIAVIGNTQHASRYESLNLSEGIAQLLLGPRSHSAASLAPALFRGFPAARFSTGSRNLPV